MLVHEHSKKGTTKTSPLLITISLVVRLKAVTALLNGEACASTCD